MRYHGLIGVAPALEGDRAEDWRDLALCRDYEPDIWFPVGHGPMAEIQTETAKAICRQCPARDACLRWALESRLAHGIAGGFDEDERRSMLADRRGAVAA